MSEQSTALRLAEHLDTPRIGQHKAAAELRRLHTVNQELLDALKGLSTAPDLSAYGMALHNARAAIAKAEGQA
jgi:hypothetical protein